MQWIVSKAGDLGGVIVQLLLMVIVAGILYASGETAARGVLRFLRRLAGDRGENSGRLAAKAVLPHAGLLSAIVFVLCIGQIGPIFVVAPATIWLYSSGSAGRGTLLLVISIVALMLDNVLRPILIKKGADLPLVLILSGVIGGVIGFGVIGLFIGPVLLAVTWTLLVAWVGDIDRAPEVVDSAGEQST